MNREICERYELTGLLGNYLKLDKKQKLISIDGKTKNR